MSSTEAGTEDSESPQVAQATNSSAYSAIEAQVDALLVKAEESFNICEQRCSSATEIIDKVNSGETENSILVDQALENWNLANHEQDFDNEVLASFMLRPVITDDEIMAPIFQRVTRRFIEWSLAKLATEVALGEALIRRASCSPVLEGERERNQELVRGMELEIQEKRQMARDLEIQANEFELGVMEDLEDT